MRGELINVRPLSPVFQKKDIYDFKKITNLFCGSYISENTKRNYSQDIEHFFYFLKDTENIFSHPREIKSYHLQDFRDFLIRVNLAKSSIVKKMVAVRQLFNWCVNEGIIDRNPLLNVKLPKVSQVSTTQSLDDWEAKLMLSIPDQSKPSGALHYLILVMLLYLGLRRDELVKIKICDFMIDRGHLVLVVHGKGDKRRLLPITVFVKKAIEQWKIASGKNFNKDSYLLMPTTNNSHQDLEKHISTTSIYKTVVKYRKKANIAKNITPHSCRATVICHLLDCKVPIRDIAVFCGHSSIMTTSRYDVRQKNLDTSPAYSVSY